MSPLNKNDNGWRKELSSMLDTIVKVSNSDDRILKAVGKKRKFYQQPDSSQSFSFPEDIAQEREKLENALELISNGKINEALGFLN